MEKIRVELNKEQFEAVNHKNGPILIVAGAGTGKTKVITERIANIIKENLAKSDEILALTFTEKAAGEMEERVDKLLPYGYLDLWISTFHSFGERVLRESGLEIGLPSDFKLLNEFEQYSLFKKNLDKFNLDYFRPLGNPTKFIRALLKHFSRAKDEDVSPEDYLKYAEELRANLDGMLSGGVDKKKSSVIARSKATKQSRGVSEKNRIASSSHSLLLAMTEGAEEGFNNEVGELEVKRIEEIANAYHVYQNLLLEESALDFGDLINYCLKLFRERPNVLEKYRARFKYILLDEFQDTNWSQYELIKILAAPNNNLTVVADDDQAIFRFRGASMSNILQFKEDYPEAKEIFLKENYRNTQNILDLSYNFITLNNPNRLEYRLREKGSKLDKKLQANTSEAGEIAVIEGRDLSEEMAKVVNKIAELKTKDKEANWGDFAILSRSNDQYKEIAVYLDEAGFPYILCSPRGLYNKEVILNSICYLRVLNNHYDGTSLFKVLSMPIFNFDFEDLASLNYLSNRKAMSLYAVLENALALGTNEARLKKINNFLSLFKKQAHEAKSRSASEIFINFINNSGYLKYLSAAGEKEYREATNYLNQFAKRIKSFEEDAPDRTIRAFLDELEAEMDAGEDGSLPVDLEGPETIKLMTVHASKGLEFKYVFIISLMDKRFPTTERGEPISLPDELVKEILPEGDYHLEEERRLFYVALTRAKRGLYLSWSRDAGGKREKKPSRFLLETKLISEKTYDWRGKEDEGGGENNSEINLLKPKKKSPVLKEVKDKIEPPKSFSYTQLAAFGNCPYQYRFAHILKVPVRGKGQFSFGKTMHGAMQKIFQAIAESGNKKQTSLFSCHSEDPAKAGDEESAPIPREEIPSKKRGGSDVKSETGCVEAGITLAECLKLYEDSWVDDWYPSEKLKEEYRQKGRQIIKDFYEKYNGRWPEVLLMEKGFNMKISVDGENFTIRGQIDRIDNLGGKIKIVDYKTGGVKEKLEFKDKAQLLIYQLAVSGLFRQEIGSLAFYYLEANKEMEFLGAPKDLEKIQEKIAENIRAIKKGEFPACPSPLCKFCDFNGICEFKK